MFLMEEPIGIRKQLKAIGFPKVQAIGLQIEIS